MKQEIKVGDIVETCRLMPAMVMDVVGRDIKVRHIDLDYTGYINDFGTCSLDHCGIIKLTAKQTLQRLALGKDRLTEIWNEFAEADYDFGKDYFKRVEEEANKLLWQEQKEADGETE